MIAISISDLVEAKMKQSNISEKEAAKEITELISYADNFVESLNHVDRSVEVHKTKDWRFTHSFRIREEIPFFDLMIFKPVKK